MPFFRRLILKSLIVSMLVSLTAAQAFATLSKRDEDLIYQSNFGDAKVVKELLEKGANPNAVSEDDWPAISLAAMRADAQAEEIVRILVNAGADLNVRDANGETPLMNAITTNNPKLVKYMIEHGADFRAVNTNGRSVESFAEHYGNEKVAFLVKEAIRLEQKRIREGMSRRRMYRLLDEFIYYNCAIQYITYNLATGLYPNTREEEMNRLLAKVTAKVHNAEVELLHNFRMRQMDMNSIATDSQKIVFDELEFLLTNRNRIKYGVGKDTDLDKRCKDVLELWRKSYQQYEDEGRMSDQ